MLGEKLEYDRGAEIFVLLQRRYLVTRAEKWREGKERERGPTYSRECIGDQKRCSV